MSDTLNIFGTEFHNVTGIKAYDDNGALVTFLNGGSAPNVGTASVTNSTNTATSISFEELEGEPIAFMVQLSTTISSSGSTTYYYVVDVCKAGTVTTGNYFRIGSTRAVYEDTTHYSASYSNSTLTVTSSAGRSSAGGSFYNGTYNLTYLYN